MIQAAQAYRAALTAYAQAQALAQQSQKDLQQMESRYNQAEQRVNSLVEGAYRRAVREKQAWQRTEDMEAPLEADFSENAVEQGPTEGGEIQDVTLLKTGEGGIINDEDIQAYQSLTAEDIAAHYKRADGGNLLDENFRAMPVEIQREAVRGYDRASKMYGGIAPNRLKAGKLGRGVYGEYSLTFGTITFDPSKRNVTQSAFGTAIHEMTHFAEDKGQFDSEKVYKAALKRLGLRANSRETSNLMRSTIGVNNNRDVGDTHEIIAFGVEKYCTGSKNKLAIAIYEILCEEGVIQQ